jgi:hypothetical protein
LVPINTRFRLLVDSGEETERVSSESSDGLG